MCQKLPVCVSRAPVDVVSSPVAAVFPSVGAVLLLEPVVAVVLVSGEDVAVLGCVLLNVFELKAVIVTTVEMDVVVTGVVELVVVSAVTELEVIGKEVAVSVVDLVVVTCKPIKNSTNNLLLRLRTCSTILKMSSQEI